MANTGSIVENWQDSVNRVARPIRTVSIAWTSDGSGAVTQPLTGGKQSGYVSGLIQRVVFVPGTSGVQPTNLYSVTLKDSSGIDVLSGQGASLSNSANTHIKPSVPMKDGTTTSTAEIAVDDILTLGVTAAGAAKQGTVILYLR